MLTLKNRRISNQWPGKLEEEEKKKYKINRSNNNDKGKTQLKKKEGKM